MNTIFIIVGFLIIAIGIVIKRFKLYDLIAGYNTMPAKEKISFDIDKFAFWFQRMFVIMGLVIVVGTMLSIVLNIKFLGFMVLILSMTICLGYLIYKGQKIKQNR